MSLIPPHGGNLIDRQATGTERENLIDRAPSMPSIHLTPREVSDLEMIATGAFSPLSGFLCKADYDTVCSEKHLVNGLPWTIPITLSVKDENGSWYREGKEVALYDEADHLLGVLQLQEKYRYEKEQEAKRVYLTPSTEHPGVAALFAQGEWLLGGPVSLISRPPNPSFPAYRLDPAQTREEFIRRGWKRIAAFQTRNPIHRAHEYLQKCALEVTDGLLIHPLVGETKSDDVPASVRMRCYEALLKNYYPPSRTMMAVFPANMRYAGPREAVFHSIVRKNYGCSHFIVGRDHAGVGKYYGTYDAHYIFDEFDPAQLGVTPLFFDHSFFCRDCGSMASTKTCPHDSNSHVVLSGTKVREMLQRGEMPPAEFSRPEVAKILIEAYGGARPEALAVNE